MQITTTLGCDFAPASNWDCGSFSIKSITLARIEHIRKRSLGRRLLDTSRSIFSSSTSLSPLGYHTPGSVFTPARAAAAATCGNRAVGEGSQPHTFLFTIRKLVALILKTVTFSSSSRTPELKSNAVRCCSNYDPTTKSNPSHPSPLLEVVGTKVL